MFQVTKGNIYAIIFAAIALLLWCIIKSPAITEKVKIIGNGTRDSSSENFRDIKSAEIYDKERLNKRNNVTSGLLNSDRGLGDARALLMPGIAEITPEAINIVLEKGEDSSLGAAALLWTQNELLWERAHAQMLHEPLFAAAIAFSGRSSEERLEAAKCLIQLEPDNPLGYLAALETCIDVGDTHQIQELLSKMPPGENIKSHAEGMRSGTRELLNLSGYNSTERGLLLSQDRWQKRVIDSLSKLSSLTSDNQSSYEDRANLASQILDLIGGYRKSAPELLPSAVLNQLSRTEEMTLRRLPNDFLLSDGVTVEKYASSLSKQRVKDIDSGERVANALRSLDKEAIGEYYEILDTKGEAEAKKWLIGE